MSTFVWAPHDTNAWEVGLVTASNDKSTTVKYPDNTTKILPLPITSLDTASPETLKADCDNLVDLDVFNEGVILHHVKKRFMKNNIYTFVGTILIAVNPYKKVDIYGVDLMEASLRAAKQSGESAIPPHIYSIAAGALVGLRTESSNHSVLISGESGAGKTEATKKILQFLSSVSSSSASRAGVSVETQILDSNPLLESFGNAKTLRNNNSSRFGKYMQINFNKRHDIKGCNVTAYLLEKSRVVTQNAGERNYHVFYMLLAGASVEMRKEFSLKPANACYYLNQSKCEEIKNRNETKEFEELVSAMGHLNFDKEEQNKIFRCLAGILHLGNVVFAPFHGDGGVEGSHIKAKADLKTAAALLGIASADELERALCFNERVIAGETTYSPIDVTRACDQRDAMAKYIYGKLFDWIVYGVNHVLYRGKPGNNIGILDIFGFEVFLVNSFEQLCINYCNERLQTFFNEVIFEGEMKVYEAEGIACDGISFQDNKGCVRLVDLKGASIFGFLDEEIMVPKGSEEKLMKKLHHYFDETAGTKSPYYGRNRKKPNTFIVKHFAGEVTYDIDNFMEKNKDTLAQSLLAQCNLSNVSLIRDPVPVIDMSGDSGAAATKVTAPEEEPPKGGKGGNGKGGKSANKLTLCAKFKIELDDLITNLRSTNPHFVRCVKPNDVQTADKFDAMLTLNQLKYSGLFEAINIRKSGFAARIPHAIFTNCYSSCVPPSAGGTKKNWAVRGGALAKSSGSVDGKRPKKPPAICHALLEFLAKEIECPNMNGQQPNWAVGVNRVFIKNQIFRNKLDAYKTAQVSNVAVVHIQRLGRGYNARRRTAHLMPVGRKNNKAESKKKEAQERGLMHGEDELSRTVEQEFLADTELQRSIKAKREANRVARIEKDRKAELNGSTLIQKMFRGVSGRMCGRVTMLEKMIERAIRSRGEGELETAVRMTSGFFYVLHHLQYRPVHRNPHGALGATFGSPMGSPMGSPPGSPFGTSLRSPPKAGGKAKYVPYTWGCSTRLLHAFHVNAKEVLLEVQGETYMSSQLQTAINTQSVSILKDALATAHSLKMDYLSEYAEAAALVDDLVHERSVLTTISETLSKCTTVPKLLDRVDEIHECIRGATRLGLSGEYAVHNAAMRLGKIKVLIELRDKMRFAVEIASVIKMEAALAERAKHVRIFGEELLTEELVAVQGLLKMFRYEEQLKHMASEKVGEDNEGSPEDDGMAAGESTPASPPAPAPTDSATTPKEKGRKTVLFDAKQDKVFQSDEDYLFRQEVPTAPDARLPPTLRHMLEEMRNAVTSAELQLAGDRLAVLVPSAERRRAVLSAFKWVVAFATWRYSFKNEAEMTMYEQHKRVIGETMNSPVKRQMGVDRVGPPQSVYRRPQQLLEVLSSPGRSFGSPIKAVSRNEQINESQRQEKRAVLAASSRAIKKSDARMEKLTSTGPRRRLCTSSMMSMASMSSFKSSGSKSSIGSTTMGPSNIPFTQRRSRSEVAALEALRKTKEVRLLLACSDTLNAMLFCHYTVLLLSIVFSIPVGEWYGDNPGANGACG